jgi:hypothetical protein
VLISLTTSTSFTCWNLFYSNHMVQLNKGYHENINRLVESSGTAV